MKKKNIPLFLDKTLSGGIVRQLSVFVLLIVLALFFFWLFCLIFNIPLTRADSGDIHGKFWNLIYFFSDSGSQTQATAQNRVFVYLISFVGSVLLSGVLISTLSNIFQRRVENVEKGLARYRVSNHIIIIGYNESVPEMIIRLKENTEYAESPIILLTKLNVSEIQMTLNANLPDEFKNKVLVYYGRCNSYDEITKLYPQHAKEVFMVSETQEEDSDSLNMECLRFMAEICRNRTLNRLKCNVVFRNYSTVCAFQRANLAKEIKETVDFYPAVHHEMLANTVLVENQTVDGKIKYPPLDRVPITENSEKFVHLVIIGMNDMGITMGIQAAHIAHFPNFERRKTKITFIDKNAKSKMRLMQTQFQSLFDVADSYYAENLEETKFSKNKKNQEYEYLGDFTDTEFYFAEGGIDTPAVRAMLERFSSDNDALLTVAICDENVHRAIFEGLFLPQIIYEKQIPVFIYQKDTASILQSLGNAESITDKNKTNRYSNIYPFGMVKNGFHLKNRSLLWAQRVNYFYSYYFEHNEVPVSLPSNKEWEEKWIPEWNLLPVAKQWSSIYNANSIPVKLRSLEIKPPEISNLVEITKRQIELMACVEHNRWVMEELIIGYRPVTKEEREKISHYPELKKEFRNRLIHVDLCHSNNLLPDIKGNNPQKYDEILIEAIPLIIAENK